jgi:tetratricopeptide (TPR) repeat protein/CHAT domain-containing protein
MMPIPSLLLAVLALLSFAAGPAPAEVPLDLDALMRDGNHAAAADSARSRLARAARDGVPDSLELATLAEVLVDASVRSGKARSEEVLDWSRRAVALRERHQGPDHPHVAVALTGLGSLLLARNEYEPARLALERALAIQERAPLDANLARTCTVLGNLHMAHADYAAARPLLERGLAIRRQVLGPDHLEVASSLSQLGTLSGNLGDYAKAREFYDQALALRARQLPPDHPLIASSHDNLGQVLRVMGDYPGAQERFERSLAIRQKALRPDDPAIATSLANLALVLRTLGDYSGAQSLLERAVRIREAALGPDDPEVARALTNLANVLRSLNDYTGARPLYERALAIREKVLGPDHPDVANSLDNFGLLLENAGDYATARAMYERALDIRVRKVGPETAAVAIAHYSLAGALDGLGDLAGARTHYDRAIALWAKTLGPRSLDVARGLNELAGVLSDLGELASARSACERGLAIRDSTLSADNPQIAESLQKLADVQVLQGELAAARASLERALAINERTLGPDDLTVAQNRYRIARVQALQGDLAGGLEETLRSDRIARGRVRETARGLAEREALRLAATNSLGQDLAMTLAVRGVDAGSRRLVLDARVRSRAQVLDEMAARHRASFAVSDTVVASRRVELERIRERLAALLVRGVADSAQRRAVDELRARGESAERRLAEVSNGFARERSRGLIDLPAVEASLPAGSALVSFARYRRIELATPGRKVANADAYAAFILRAGDGTPDVVDLGSAQAVEEQVLRWARDVAALRPPHNGAQLRRTIWDPIATRLAGATRVFLVPDGALNLVNLAALPDARGGYLVEHGPLLHVVSAERDLVPFGDAPGGAGLLALGAIDYDADTRMWATSGGTAAGETSSGAATRAAAGTDCDALLATRFEPLAATGAETGEIVELWRQHAGARGDAREVRGAEAREGEFKRQAPARRVLHVATHGFFLGRCGEAPQSSRGLGRLSASAAPAPAPRAAVPAADGNPLRLSGLVFAGANHRAEAQTGDDGVLTAGEAASLDLSGAEWVVLSACESGAGDVHAGEGVFGLRRAFQIAGARTLITSLWSVEDASTRAWMKALYVARLVDGADTAEAVRRASLAVLRQRRARGMSTHPFFWGGFLAAGDWR